MDADAPPSESLCAVGAERWPDAPAARRALAMALRALPNPAPWRALVAWAFAVHHDAGAGGAPIAAVCALLGVSRPTLFAWRAADPVVGALPATRVKRAPGTPIRGDTRAARAERRGLPRDRQDRAAGPDVPPWMPRELAERIAAAGAGAPRQTERAAGLVAVMCAAYDGADDDVGGVGAALDVLDSAGVDAGEASAAVRAFLAARVG